MKYINHILRHAGGAVVTGLLAFSVFSCGGGGGSEPEPKPVLEVKTGAVSAVAAAGTYTVEVTASEEWSAACDSAWCRTSQSSSVLTLNVSANPRASVRTAQVKVTMASLSRVVTVTQAAAGTPVPEEQLEVAPVEIPAGYAAGEYRITVSGNVAWSVSSNQGWCRAVKEDNGVRINLGMNDQTSERLAVVTVSGGKLSRPVQITQMGITLRGLDSLTLVAVANSTEGSNWKTPWNTTQALTAWKGVRLDAAGKRVEELALRGNRLKGVFPAGVLKLTALRRLDLGHNTLSGGVPAAINELQQLEELSLDSNGMDGLLPGNLNRLTKLRVLDLGYNDFEGVLPPDVASLANLAWLRLAGNNFDGELPTGWKSLTALVVLDVSQNQLGGAIPAGWIQAMYKLEYLYLYGNQLNQPIPAGVVSLYALKSLALDHNRLTGNIPDELGHLPSLTGLWLYNNELTGIIPTSLTSHRLWEDWKPWVCPQLGTGFDAGCPPVGRSGGSIAARPLPAKSGFLK